MGKSFAVFNTTESIERLAEAVDLAITNVEKRIKRVKDEYTEQSNAYEQWRALPFFTRIRTKRPLICGDALFYEKPALHYNLDLFDEINNMIVMQASEIRVDSDTLTRIKNWSA